MRDICCCFSHRGSATRDIETTSIPHHVLPVCMLAGAVSITGPFSVWMEFNLPLNPFLVLEIVYAPAWVNLNVFLVPFRREHSPTSFREPNASIGRSQNPHFRNPNRDKISNAVMYTNRDKDVKRGTGQRQWGCFGHTVWVMHCGGRRWSCAPQNPEHRFCPRCGMHPVPGPDSHVISTESLDIARQEG